MFPRYVPAIVAATDFGHIWEHMLSSLQERKICCFCVAGNEVKKLTLEPLFCKIAFMEPHDQKFYDIVAGEIRSRFVVDGLWVRAFSDADGDEAKAKATYITRRVEQLKAEVQAAKSAAFERAQAEARENQEQRNRLKREQRDMRARERQAERQRPLDPKGKKLLAFLFVIVFAITFLILTRL